jgi:hypothetical protein
LLVAVIATGVLAGATGISFAGSGNVLYLLQDSGSSPGPVGESFQSDHSNSNFSSIGWPALPVRQSGAGDSATLTIISNCGAVSPTCGHADLTQGAYSVDTDSAPQRLAQDAKAALAGDYFDANGTLQAPGLNPAAVALSLSGVSDNASGANSSTILVTGPGSAAVTQYGTGNVATLTVSSANGNLNQVGTGNNATVNVTSGSFTFNQIGEFNSANLSMAVPANASATYTQVGVQDSWGSAGNPVTLFSTSDGLNVAHYSYNK